jgi:ribonucleoside-diphosphate reductase beta chain
MFKAVNWNRPDDTFTLEFWNQNVKQFWLDTEIPLSDDKIVWINMNPESQEVYKKVLGGLTLLDTVQGTVGVPALVEHEEGLQRKAVLSFMGMMENIHAKSYSSIFTTLCTMEEIDEIFAWVEQNPYLQKKAEIIQRYYKNIKTPKDRYLAKVASVFLESFLFYSGFFYPIYLAGQGILTSSGEIIFLIIRDESIHGLYVGALAQEDFAKLTEEEQEAARKEVHDLLMLLYENEVEYTKELYAPVGLVDEVLKFLRYNANKAMQNLGLEPIFEEEEINAIVLNGLSTHTVNHDFFSVKGNGYVKSLNVRKLTDEDFVFDIIDEFGDHLDEDEEIDLSAFSVHKKNPWEIPSDEPSKWEVTLE